MSSINDVAQEISLNPIECPHCHRQINTSGLIKALFQRVLRRIGNGESVFINGFGSFHAVEMKARRIQTGLFDVEVPKLLRVSFKQSRYAKASRNKKRKVLHKARKKIGKGKGKANE